MFKYYIYIYYQYHSHYDLIFHDEFPWFFFLFLKLYLSSTLKILWELQEIVNSLNDENNNYFFCILIHLSINSLFYACNWKDLFSNCLYSFINISYLYCKSASALLYFICFTFVSYLFFSYYCNNSVKN